VSRLTELVAAAYAAFPVDQSLDLITELSRLDRFQASHGIETAADLVAEQAERSGIHSVRVMRFPADAGWWSFRPPAPWTPRRAALDLLGPAGSRRMVAFPELACSLATYSAPACLPGAPLVLAGSGADPAGAVVVLSRRAAAQGPPLPLLVERLTAAGAAGIVTDLAAPDEPSAAGRVELPRDARLFCFSVPAAVLTELTAAARDGARVRVNVDVDRVGRMPLVHGTLPGTEDLAPILIQAHLCHPRPSANDNASGVAAAVGVAQTLAAIGTGPMRRPVSFLWAPEFAGTAAYLHDVAGRAPALAVNLDMVGEDQAQCGGPLLVEEPPAHRPSMLPALFADALEALPTGIRSYSTARPLRTWNWAGTPFAGGSDHAVFADRSVGTSAVGVGHWPDRFRHTSLDTVQRVDPQELRRVGAATAAVAGFAAGAGPGDRPEIESSVARWASAGLTALARTVAERPAGLPVRRLADHQVRSAGRAVRQAAALIGAAPHDWRRHHDWLAAQARTLSGPDRHAGEESPAGGPVVRRTWAGPFNLEGLVAAASPPDREWILTEDDRRLSAYTEMLAIALAVDDTSTVDGIAATATCSTWLSPEPAFVHRFVEVLADAGWVSMSPLTAGGGDHDGDHQDEDQDRVAGRDLRSARDEAGDGPDPVPHLLR
jgi:hypothetical protein